MNAQDKAEALRLLTSILTRTYGTEQRSAEADDLRALIERQNDTDGKMWRFCVEHGFPLVLTNSKWVAHFGVRLRCADTPAEAVQAAMAAMKERS